MKFVEMVSGPNRFNVYAGQLGEDQWALAAQWLGKLSDYGFVEIEPNLFFDEMKRTSKILHIRVRRAYDVIDSTIAQFVVCKSSRDAQKAYRLIGGADPVPNAPFAALGQDYKIHDPSTFGAVSNAMAALALVFVND